MHELLAVRDDVTLYDAILVGLDHHYLVLVPALDTAHITSGFYVRTE